MAPRVPDSILPTTVIHGNSDDHHHLGAYSPEQLQPYAASSFPNEQSEKREADEAAAAEETEVTPTKGVAESVLLPLFASGNDVTRSNEDDAVGTYRCVREKFR